MIGLGVPPCLLVVGTLAASTLGLLVTVLALLPAAALLTSRRLPHA